MFALIGWIGRVLLILFIVRLVTSFFSGGTRRASAPGGGARPNRGPAGTAGSRGNVGARLVRDPHCGTYVAETSAVRALSGGQMVYFCSDKCRDAHLASPQASAS